MGVTSVARALDVLEYLSARTRPVPAAVIRRHYAIPKSSLHHLLHELEERGFAVYHPRERGWGLGPRLRELTSEAPLFAHALAVLEALPSGASGLAPRRLAEATRLPAKAVERILAELERSEFVALLSDGSYTLGLELTRLAARIRWLEQYRLAARPVLVHLRDITGETANLFVRDGDTAMYIDQVESRSPLRFSNLVGLRVPIADSASGAALLDAFVCHVVSGEVDSVRATAVACGVGGVEPPLAVGILAPTERLEMTGADRAAHWVEAAARQIGERLVRHDRD